MMDLNNSPFLQNRVTQNTQEGFFTAGAYTRLLFSPT